MNHKKIILCLVLGLVGIATKLVATVNEASEDPGFIKFVGMRQYITCSEYGYFTTFTCDHYLNPGELLGFNDGQSQGCDFVYIAENVTLIPRPGFQQYQVWISDWAWKELVIEEDGSNPRWEDRITPGHWITASLPTARSAAPGAWTLENIAANPLGYYNADPVTFTSMLPDWKFNLVASGGAWGDWALANPAELKNARLAVASAPPMPWPVEIPRVNPTAVVITLAVVALLEITKHLDYSYVTYEKEYLWNPALHYYGQSFGRGVPNVVMKNRDRYHERNHDHWAARLRAYVYTYGLSDYGDFAMHGREQQLVDLAGGLVNQGAGGKATNSIRPVAKYNPLGYPYWLTANTAYGYMAPYSGYWWNTYWFIPPATTSWTTVIDQQAIP